MWVIAERLQEMTEEQLLQWAQANSARLHLRHNGATVLHVAAGLHLESLPLVVWLVEEMGVNVNAITTRRQNALHTTASFDILNVLLDLGADPLRRDSCGQTPLIRHTWFGRVDLVERLLQDPRVRATVNMQDRRGHTALFEVASVRKTATVRLVHLLLQAGCDPSVTNNRGQTVMAFLRTFLHTTDSTLNAAVALIKQAPEAEKTSFLVKARRLAVAATSPPSCLQARVAQGQPLPRLIPVGGTRKLRLFYEFILGVGGPSGEGMPRDVFSGVFVDLLAPSWDPLRRKNT
jgi:hypothetical protein